MNNQHIKDYALKHYKEGNSITQLAQECKDYFDSHLTVEQIRKIASREINKLPKYKSSDTLGFRRYGTTGTVPNNTITYTINPPITEAFYPKPKIVGIIGDTHEPFTHSQYRDFCYETFNKYKVTDIVHIGDEVDNHAISFHEHDPNGYSAGKEADIAQEAMNKWYNLFPKVNVIIGNHTALPYRQANSIGLPRKFIKTYEQIWNAPIGWKWDVELEIDHVLYRHGTGSSGQNGAINLAIEMLKRVKELK